MSTTRTFPIRARRLAFCLAAGLSLVAAACGDDSGSTSATAAPAASTATTTAAPATTMAPSSSMGSDSTMAPSSTMAAGTGMTQPFGPACGSVPTSGPGSFDGMAKDPAATAASNNPALSTLVTAVKAAGLVDTLNGPGPFTIFAPTNDAFAKIDKATMDTVMADPSGDLTKILTYHVVAGQALTPEQLTMGMLKTVNGSDLTVTKSGDTYMVNGQSTVVCGNVQTANATVYIIDTVLMPPSA